MCYLCIACMTKIKRTWFSVIITKIKADENVLKPFVIRNRDLNTKIRIVSIPLLFYG